MPAHKSAIKRLRQSKTNHDRNTSTKTALKTMRKKIVELLPAKREEALKALPAIQAALDKAAKRGIIHHKKAARLKSRLMHRLNAPAAAAAGATA